MDDLLTEFVAESREMLEALGGEIVAWEADPGDRARLDAIFRFMHTVKGNCGFFDFPRLQALSHAAEDVLADVRAGRRPADAALVDAVLAIVDRIGDMIAAIERGEDLPDTGDAPLIAALDPDAANAGAPAAFPPGSGERPARGLAAPQRSVRLPVELLDRVMSGVSDMVLARNALARRLRDVPEAEGLQAPFDRLTAIIADVRDAMTRARMQRMDILFGALPRLVRDLSGELGKQVMIDVVGGEVELDREMIEMIRDPLTHILRNAVGHGIEPPAARLAAGKREIGLLTVSARQSGNRILIEVRDDGGGIDGARLVEKAVAAGIVSAAEGPRLSERERCALIFAPGLSTADAVTAISGRGVGMDVVRANIERIGGTIDVESAPGQGTRVTLRVPLTLTIIPALTIGAGGQHFAIPRTSIEEIVEAGGEGAELVRLGGAMLARVRGRRLPCVALAQVLGLPDASDAPVLVVLRLAGGERFVLAVDRLYDHGELVAKPVAPALAATGLYAGATLTDDGCPMLLLEVAGLAEAGGLQLEAQDRQTPADAVATREEQPAPSVVLFIGLDGRRRAIRMAAVDRIEDIAAAAVDRGADRLHAVVDGGLLPLAGADRSAVFAGPLKLFRLTDGVGGIGYIAREVIDIRPLAGEIVPAAVPGEIEGVTLIDGEPVEVVDTHWLFAGRADPEQRAAPQICRLPQDDAWMQNFLRPLVEAAGWTVVGPADASRADVEIAAAGASLSLTGAGRVIRLRSTPDEAPETVGSIYRYDRAGLLAALGGVAAGGRGR